jgi:pimeloyl-ACP methyl ester carboxylesterase
MTQISQGLEAIPQAASPRGRFFTNQTFHYETVRNAGYILSQCADLGEMLETTKEITEGDLQSWYGAWAATADRLEALAARTQDPLSKGGAYMRASTYQRMGEFLLPPDDPKRPESFDKTVRLFFQGLDALAVRYECFSAPYENGRLRALYLPGPAGSEKKPLIVAVGGYDSILEEKYPVIGKAALDRGYSVLIYEGPGQGEPLRKYGMKFTPEWEKPNTAVLDEFLRTHDKPSKVVLLGMSLGGYFAPRAAAFEERIDGVVAYGVAFDVQEFAGRFVAAAKNPLALKTPDVSWGYHNALWTLGTTNPDDTLEAFSRYKLAPVADRIRQDVLILAGREDHFIPFHQVADFEKSLVNARSVTTRIFDRPSGGAEHCQCGNTSLVHAARLRLAAPEILRYFLDLSNKVVPSRSGWSASAPQRGRSKS